VGAVRSRSLPHEPWEPARVNRLRLGTSAARTARPCGESLLELTFQTLGGDVMFWLNLHRDLDPDSRGLKADDLHVVGHVLPIRMVIALAFCKRIFARWLPMNQAHGLIVAEVYGTCSSARTRRSRGQGSSEGNASSRRRLAKIRNSPNDRSSVRWNDRSRRQARSASRKRSSQGDHLDLQAEPSADAPRG
jgi:hypothetical protein